ncbi:DUF6452 family protein [Flavobacterium gilvum]|uniref:Uncharacterized protein n=1 Tax=Flavobacterium gilvum TaxID=1492737 RepID=A0AAC9N5W7_9FLAO|nr:DUF6452 family protein [Flavobacterium gilvum]AOW09792.1 hypothetical protein EM308_09900 [Flavobacterium gilvum]KFC60346.1 hypothetical protein FEM08_08230 [Flavobacterium gilvum]
MKKIIAFIIILGFASSSCEPDDICDPNTPTTPRMLIQFYDISNPSVQKNVTNLKVIGDGMSEGVVFNPSAVDDSKYLTNSNNVLLPLKTDADVVKYQFILNYGNKNPLLVNTDNLEFRYTRENLYVSRACGFKTIFTLDPSNPFTLTDKVPADNLWIQYMIVVQNNITYENETIIKIFF